MTATAALLPDAELRTYFTDAPEDMSVPTDVSTLFKARLRRCISKHKVWLIAMDVAFVIAAIAMFVVAFPVGGIIALLAPIVIFGIIMIVQHGKAKDDFFEAYATARGLTYVENCSVPTKAVPLMRRGDKRKCEQALQGNIHGTPATLANYTYTEVSYDSDGKRKETDYDYLMLHVGLPKEVAERFQGVYLTKAGWTLGKLGDKLGHDRGVKLESVDFHKRYNLRVVDAQDDIALYELFHPGFIDALTTGPEIYWEQVGGDLIFYRKKHESEAADLDAFVAQSRPVLDRYLEEHR